MNQFEVPICSVERPICLGTDGKGYDVTDPSFHDLIGISED